MRTSTIVRAAAILTTTVLTGALLAQPAMADDTPLPVVGPDTVTLYPGQSTELNVLDNDTSPSGDDLALCRFPAPDLEATHFPAVSVMALEDFFAGGPGDLLVTANLRAHGTHEFHYYVCDHTHLVPATLTVVVRDVQPVDVTKLAQKAGRLHVTNHNTKPIHFWYGDPQGGRADGKIRVAAGDTVTVRVQRHVIAWAALIGPMGKAAMLSGGPGIADFGVVRGIKLNGKALPAPHGGGGPDGSMTALAARWR